MSPDYEFEWQTRKSKVDVLLKEQGWDVADRTKVVLEVDTKQSDFKAKIYKTASETLKRDGEHAYADYLLLDKTGAPLAVVEAKRTSKDATVGQKQAENYAEDIRKQTGKPVFIFFTNGYEIWFYNKPYENPRLVKGFHHQDCLERMRLQNENKQNLLLFQPKREIIDRDYQIEAVKRILEGIEGGKRKFLIVQATGTGKTRVAMALIDILRKSHRAQKILFLADRKALRDQAYNEGFKVFFPHEGMSKVFSGALDKSARLYASTIQTFMECYQEFSTGDFDIIISDECHRSIYNKWKDVFTYFDAIQIGLTATPADMIERDTFRFFNCEDNTPTCLYTYEQAVKEKWLAPYNVYETQTQFQIKGIKPEDIPDRIKDEILEKGQCENEEDLNFEGTDIEKKVAVLGTNEAIVKEFMENCLTDQTGTLPAKSIFFAISKKHAKRIWEAFEKLYPQYKGRITKIITSEDTKAQELIKEFKNENFPKVAISVDMLDTGIDIPECCNLVFAKPVFSKIKFWQMIGRGTRADAVCRHKEWLPDGKKEEFKIFDCWKVFDWFGMHPEGKETQPSEALPAKIFLKRLEQYRYFAEKKDKGRQSAVRKKIMSDIGKLPKSSISVREHITDVEKAEEPNFWDKVGLDPVEFLRKKLTPLMKYQKDVNPEEASFILKAERLAFAILSTNKDEIDYLKESICETLECLPMSINKVRDKSELINKIQSKAYWKNVSFDDAEEMLRELAPLMTYKRSEPRPQIILDIDDVIQQRRLIEYGPLPTQEYVETYKKKVESRIKELADRHPTIMKIKDNRVLTEEDLNKLDKTLNGPELYITEEVLQDVYKQHRGTLVQFVKKVIGMYEFPDPKEKIEEAFKTFMVENNMNSNQVNFMRTLKTVFMQKHHVEYDDLFEPPFTTFGVDAATRFFQDEQIKEILEICHNLESEVFSHA